MKEWPTFGLESLPFDLFKGFLLNAVLTHLCKRSVTFDAVPIVCPYSFAAQGGSKPHLELKVISQHSWVSWTLELEVPLS